MKEQYNKEMLSIKHGNIQGIGPTDDRKHERNEFISCFKENDIICLTETHITENEDISISGFHSKHICRDKCTSNNRTYGGISILFRIEISKGIDWIDNTCNEYVWFKLRKQFFGLEKDLFICAIYMPPENTSYSKSNHLDTFEMIERDIVHYGQTGNILLIGDMNARTGTHHDFIENDSKIDDECFEYFIDKQHYIRTSEDNIICKRGKILLNTCMSFQLRILNGRCLGDCLGRYTCRKHNGSRGVDYGVTDESNLKNIIMFMVDDFKGDLSDHCSITCNIKFLNHQV
jgi:exonuclease III